VVDGNTYIIFNGILWTKSIWFMSWAHYEPSLMQK